MNTLRKEWRQQRGPFLLFCLAGITLPTIEALQAYRYLKMLSVSQGSTILVASGALFAVILSAMSMRHDVGGTSDLFWRTKPVTARRLLGFKLSLAAALLLMAFSTMIVLQMIAGCSSGHFDHYATVAWQALWHTYPLGLMLFALTMFLMVLMRETRKAVLLAVWVALILYTIPMLMPSMNWMTVFKQKGNSGYIDHSMIMKTIVLLTRGDKPHLLLLHPFYVLQELSQDYPWTRLFPYLQFLGAMVGAACVFLVLSARAICKGWRWNPEHKSMVWIMGVTSVSTVSLGMFHVGSNLPPKTSYEGAGVSPGIELSSSPDHTGDWAGDDAGEMIGYPENVWVRSSELSVHNGHAYLIRSVEGEGDKDNFARADWYMHVYRLPAPTGTHHHPSMIRIAATPPARRGMPQDILFTSIRGDRLFVAYVPRLENGDDVKSPVRLLVCDVNNPARPERIDDSVVYEPSAFAVDYSKAGCCVDDYCYVSLMDELVVFLINEEDRIEVIKRTGLDHFNISNLRWLPSRELSVVDEGRIMCFDGNGAMVLSVEDPANPELLYYGSFGDEHRLSGDYIRSATCHGDYLYLSRTSGIYVYRISDGSNDVPGNLLGSRRSTALERFVGHQPNHLLVYQGWLVESWGSLGMLIYDISDPARPRRTYHATQGIYTSRIVIWNGNLYAGNPHHTRNASLTLFEIP